MEAEFLQIHGVAEEGQQWRGPVDVTQAKESYGIEPDLEGMKEREWSRTGY